MRASEFITEGQKETQGLMAWRVDFGDKFKALSSVIPERMGKIYLMPMDYSALDTFGNLTGEEPDQINSMPSEVYKVSGDALVGDMSIINEIVNAMHYMQQNKSNPPLKRQYESQIAKLKKQYLDTRVSYSQYRPGKFDMPEILADPDQIQKTGKSVSYDQNTGDIVLKNQSKRKPDLAEADYHMQHRPADKTSGSPMHDLSGVYPDDIYGPRGAEYYGHYGQNNPLDIAAIHKIRAARGKPRKGIQIYRAVPPGVKEILPGDWVTTVKAYALEHGAGLSGGKYKIISRVVKAGDLYTEGNSILEWGWDP